MPEPVCRPRCFHNHQLFNNAMFRRYWTYLTTDCAICVQVCPWNRGNSALDVLWKALAATRLRHLMLLLHKWQIDTKLSNKRWFRYSTVGRKLKPLRWWAGEESAEEERRVRRPKQAGRRRKRDATKKRRGRSGGGQD